MWCPRTDSNRGPIDYKSIALPAELQGHGLFCRLFSLIYQLIQYKIIFILLACEACSQLSVTKSEPLWQINRYGNRYENPTPFGISNLLLTSLKQNNGVEKMKRIKFTKTDIEKLEHPTGKIHFCISLF